MASSVCFFLAPPCAPMCPHVLQTFLHTPPLRSHFLAGRHKHSGGCQALGGGPRVTVPAAGPPSSGGLLFPCLGCELETLFEEAHSGNCRPFNPSRFLYWYAPSSPCLALPGDLM